MMTRLALIFAATALTCAPALAGYTIFEDEALPSVLFVEFDNATPVSTGPAPRPLSGPAVIGVDGTATPVSDTPSPDGAAEGADATASGGDATDGEKPAATAEKEEEERDTFADSMDSALEIKDSDFRDFVVQQEIRREILND